MSTNSQDQEIDLGQVFKKIGGFFQSIVDSLFDFILFSKKNIIIIGVLFIAGAVLGFLTDTNNKSYSNEIIVTPNFGSVDYLYSKIELLNSKKAEKDTLFLNKLGFKDIKNLGKIKIEPIIDVYKFIDGKAENFELIKLMAEDGDIDKIVENELTSKNYPLHKITFNTSKNTATSKTVNPLLTFLNDSEYYKKIQKQFCDNVNIKLNANDSVINQIDKLLNDFSRSIGGNNLVYYNNENSQLNDIINTKNGLISEQGSLRMNLIGSDKIIKDISITTNIMNTKGTQGKMKFILPILFVALFFLFVAFRKFYAKQLQKRNLA